MIILFLQHTNIITFMPYAMHMHMIYGDIKTQPISQLYCALLLLFIQNISPILIG